MMIVLCLKAKVGCRRITAKSRQGAEARVFLQQQRKKSRRRRPPPHKLLQRVDEHLFHRLVLSAILGGEGRQHASSDRYGKVVYGSSGRNERGFCIIHHCIISKVAKRDTRLGKCASKHIFQCNIRNMALGEHASQPSVWLRTKDEHGAKCTSTKK